MAETDVSDETVQGEVLGALLDPRENPFPESRPAHLDDVVFLSAALTRLVIDPYREACSTRTRISRTIEIGEAPKAARSVEIEQPFLFAGFDEAPKNVRQALAGALGATGCGYVGSKPLTAGNPADRPYPWFQLVAEGDRPDPGASGLIYIISEDNLRPEAMMRLKPDQLVGLAVKGAGLPKALPFALEQELDLLLLDGGGIETPWIELTAVPDLTVMRDAIRMLRKLNMEEEIALVNFGGMRSGTDVAKALAMNCTASVIGAALGFAAGGVQDGDNMVFPEDAAVEDLQSLMVNWIKATAQETAIIARCTGKTNVHNLEPEDMRTITLAANRDLGIPLASGQRKREEF